jgi:pimeloyl-ACP methyl ester carboxylesterase
MYVLAIDLPGHGLSSHIPSGVPYTDLTWVFEIKRIVDYLKWTKFSIIAHSMGANASLHFALLFQDLVERVITLDTVKPAVFPINELADRTKQDIQNFLSLEERAKRIKNPDPVFSYDTAIQTLKVAHSPIGNYLFVIIILIRKHLKSICVIFIKETSHPKAPLVF